jgi:copper(I)-binding protein
MKLFLATVFFTLSVSTAMLADDASMAKLGDLMIHDGWARASIGRAPNSAAYMTLMTHGSETDKLVAVSTPAAETAELHTHLMENDIAKMRPVDAIEVAPGEPTVLEPGGLHVMLMGLKEALEEGSELSLTLTFENAGEVTFNVPVLGMKGVMKHGEDKQHTH